MTQRTLLILGATILAVGLFWPFLSKFGLGRLPGDIIVKREGFSFFFPVTTMVLVSAALTLLFRLFGK